MLGTKGERLVPVTGREATGQMNACWGMKECLLASLLVQVGVYVGLGTEGSWMNECLLVLAEVFQAWQAAAG